MPSQYYILAKSDVENNSYSAVSNVVPEARLDEIMREKGATTIDAMGWDLDINCGTEQEGLDIQSFWIERGAVLEQL